MDKCLSAPLPQREESRRPTAGLLRLPEAVLEAILSRLDLKTRYANISSSPRCTGTAQRTVRRRAEPGGRWQPRCVDSTHHHMMTTAVLQHASIAE